MFRLVAHADADAMLSLLGTFSPAVSAPCWRWLCRGALTLVVFAGGGTESAVGRWSVVFHAGTEYQRTWTWVCPMSGVVAIGGWFTSLRLVVRRRSDRM